MSDLVILNAKVERMLKIAVEEVSHAKFDTKGNRVKVSAYLRTLLLETPEIKKKYQELQQKK